MSCTSEELRNTTDHCAYVTAYCSSDSVVNVYNVYYCLLKENIFASIPLGVPCVVQPRY